MKIIVLCTGNTCRSQMAEGFLKQFDENLEVYSAGVKAEERVNPRAITVMQEIGIDISGHKPEQVDKYLSTAFDFVITVCDHAKETCPVFAGKVGKRLHFGFPDPAALKGTDAEVLPEYRRVRADIHKTLKQFYKTQVKRN